MKKQKKGKRETAEIDPTIKAMFDHFSPPPNQGSGEIKFDWRMLILLAPLLPYFAAFYPNTPAYRCLLVYSILIIVLHLCFVARLKEAMAHILNPFNFVKIVMINFILVVIHFGLLFTFLQKIDPTQFKTESSDPLFINMIYYSVVTIATVGYGDIVPASWISKLMTTCEILVGIWFLIMMIPIAVADQVERIRHFRETKQRMMEEIQRGIEEGRLKPVPDFFKEKSKDEKLPPKN